MQLSVRVLCLVTTLVTSITLPAHGREPPAQPGKAAWPRCGRVTEFPGPAWSPQQPPAGWEIEKLSRAKNLFDSLDSSAVMVIHGGRPVAAWGDVDVKYTAQSVRKALISSLVGIAVAENRLELDDTLEELGIDDTGPGLTPAERRATLRDLLMSRSGVFHSALYEVGNWKRVRAELAKTKSADPERFRPGAYWVYNNWDFNAVGTIVEQAFGQPMGLTFENRIAEPIGMQDFTPADVEYTDKNDSTEKHFGNWSEHRAYVFNLSTRDLARYGLL